MARRRASCVPPVRSGTPHRITESPPSELRALVSPPSEMLAAFGQVLAARGRPLPPHAQVVVAVGRALAPIRAGDCSLRTSACRLLDRCCTVLRTEPRRARVHERLIERPSEIPYPRALRHAPHGTHTVSRTVHLPMAEAAVLPVFHTRWAHAMLNGRTLPREPASTCDDCSMVPDEGCDSDCEWTQSPCRPGFAKVPWRGDGRSPVGYHTGPRAFARVQGPPESASNPAEIQGLATRRRPGDSCCSPG